MAGLPIKCYACNENRFIKFIITAKYTIRIYSIIIIMKCNFTYIGTLVHLTNITIKVRQGLIQLIKNN